MSTEKDKEFFVESNARDELIELMLDYYYLLKGFLASEAWYTIFPVLLETWRADLSEKIDRLDALLSNLMQLKVKADETNDAVLRNNVSEACEEVAKRIPVIEATLSHLESMDQGSTFLSSPRNEKRLEITHKYGGNVDHGENLGENSKIYQIYYDEMKEKFTSSPDSSKDKRSEIEFNLGRNYAKKGELVKAAIYYRSAANQGHIKAQVRLGDYLAKQGNRAEANYYYKLAAGQGYVKAQFNLGIYYTKTRNDPQAVKYFRLAAKQGHIEAQFRLGYYLAKEGHQEMANFYYRLAAHQGHVKAGFNVGNYYARKEKFTQAIEYFRLAADKGHREAQFALGYYLAKQGNREDANYYYTLAASQGHVSAQRNLGKYYLSIGNSTEAIKYLDLTTNQLAPHRLSSSFASSACFFPEFKVPSMYEQQKHADQEENTGPSSVPVASGTEKLSSLVPEPDNWINKQLRLVD